MKRLVLLCDGTLEDADRQQDEALLTNIARLSRAIVEVDTRSGRMVEQIKLYQSGVGTDEKAVNALISGAFGRGMMEKVKDLYDFLAINWEEGDEVYLFGFSRGAYIVRLLACLVDIIGILPPRKYLHLFPRIFEALDAHTGKGDDDDHKAIETIRELLAPLEAVRNRQRQRDGGFLIQCVGVFDTVGTRGRPSFLRSPSFTAAPTPPSVAPAELNSFGLPSTHLPACVRVALQALALDEHRKDYAPVLWRRWQKGDAKGRQEALAREAAGQRLCQVWFAGAHADVGGGYAEADLSFLALEWMVSRLSDNLAIDDVYLERIYSRTNAAWGEMQPHQSRVDEFRLAPAMDRAVPSLPIDPCTSQYLHASLLAQPTAHVRPEVRPLLRRAQRSLFATLGEREVRLLRQWAAPVQRGRSTLERTKTAPAALPVADEHDGSGDVRKGRPSSVTSFTDNEDSPPPSPSPSDDGAFPALDQRQLKHRTRYQALQRGLLHWKQMLVEHGRHKYV